MALPAGRISSSAAWVRKKIGRQANAPLDVPGAFFQIRPHGAPRGEGMDRKPAPGSPHGEGQIVTEDVPPRRQPAAGRRFAHAAPADKQHPPAVMLHQGAVERKAAPCSTVRFVDGKQGASHLLPHMEKIRGLVEPADDLPDSRMAPDVPGNGDLRTCHPSPAHPCGESRKQSSPAPDALRKPLKADRLDPSDPARARARAGGRTRRPTPAYRPRIRIPQH